MGLKVSESTPPLVRIWAAFSVTSIMVAAVAESAEAGEPPASTPLPALAELEGALLPRPPPPPPRYPGAPGPVRPRARGTGGPLAGPGDLPAPPAPPRPRAPPARACWSPPRALPDSSRLLPVFLSWRQDGGFLPGRPRGAATGAGAPARRSGSPPCAPSARPQACTFSRPACRATCRPPPAACCPGASCRSPAPSPGSRSAFCPGPTRAAAARTSASEPPAAALSGAAAHPPRGELFFRRGLATWGEAPHGARGPCLSGRRPDRPDGRRGGQRALPFGTGSRGSPGLPYACIGRIRITRIIIGIEVRDEVLRAEEQKRSRSRP